jgi:hypothetical protein
MQVSWLRTIPNRKWPGCPSNPLSSPLLASHATPSPNCAPCGPRRSGSADWASLTCPCQVMLAPPPSPWSRPRTPAQTSRREGGPAPPCRLPHRRSSPPALAWARVATLPLRLSKRPSISLDKLVGNPLCVAGSLTTRRFAEKARNLSAPRPGLGIAAAPVGMPGGVRHSAGAQPSTRRSMMVGSDLVSLFECCLCGARVHRLGNSFTAGPSAHAGPVNIA